MSLSNERKELFEDLLKQFKKVKDIDKVLFVTFNCIDDQDEEFIKKLKGKFKLDRPYFSVEINACINEEAGEDLSK